MIINITELITVISLISLSSERVVEVIKGMIPTPGVKIKTGLYTIISLISSVIIYVTNDFNVLPEIDKITQALFIGLVCSAGSGFWHNILQVVTSLKVQKPV